MTNELRAILTGPGLALCVVGLLGSATACSGTIDAQDTKPSISNSGSGGGSATNPLNPQPGINENSPNVSGRATGSDSDGQQTADDIDRASSPRSSAGGSRSRSRAPRRDAGLDDAGVEADAGEVDGGVEVDAGAIDAGAADAAP